MTLVTQLRASGYSGPCGESGGSAPLSMHQGSASVQGSACKLRTLQDGWERSPAGKACPRVVTTERHHPQKEHHWMPPPAPFPTGELAFPYLTKAYSSKYKGARTVPRGRPNSLGIFIFQSMITFPSPENPQLLEALRRKRTK